MFFQNLSQHVVHHPLQLVLFCKSPHDLALISVCEPTCQKLAFFQLIIPLNPKYHFFCITMKKKGVLQLTLQFNF